MQQFAGYVPPQFRSYWSTRGWYTQLGGLRDPRNTDITAGTEALREAIVREINSNPDVRSMKVTAGWNSQVAKPLRRQCAAGSPARPPRT